MIKKMFCVFRTYIQGDFLKIVRPNFVFKQFIRTVSGGGPRKSDFNLVFFAMENNFGFTGLFAQHPYLLISEPDLAISFVRRSFVPKTSSFILSLFSI